MPNEEATTSKQEGQSEETTETPDFNTVANQAAAAHAKRLEKQLMKTFEEKFGALNTTLEKLAQAQAPAPKTSKSKEEDPEMSAIKQQLEQFKATAEASERRASEAEKRRRDEQTLNDVRRYLANGGVRSEAVGVGTDYLVKATNKIEYDEEGNVLFKFKKSSKDDEVLMPLEDGITSWLKTTEAALFLPAPATSSAGKQPATKTTRRASDGKPVWDKPAATDAERIARADEMARWYASKQKSET